MSPPLLPRYDGLLLFYPGGVPSMPSRDVPFGVPGPATRCIHTDCELQVPDGGCMHCLALYKSLIPMIIQGPLEAVVFLLLYFISCRVRGG
jgi:hypothetical protein